MLDRTLLVCLAVVCLAVIKISADDDAEEVYEGIMSAINDEIESPSKSLKQRYLARLERIFECKKKDEGCNGVVRCCDTLQCYWEAGYSAIKKGVCVTCVQKDKKCQRDAQCCSGFVCQKDNVVDMNGICDVKRGAGKDCHETDQCSSGRCIISNWQRMTFQEGKCA